ncbi:MAG: DUF669 domain-containing protein [Phycisphaerales bacterium]|jgi:hypothetical protein|nr:DUF669 domain-containing protein [Phycisphaerales bacterium]
MEFNPEDGASRSGFELLPAGEYDIEVIESEERTSQKGNQMIALTLQTKHPDGYDSRVWDYLVSVPAAVFKIKMFCDATGLTSRFEAGKLTAEDCLGKRAKARITVEEGREGFGDRNSVAEYLGGGGGEPQGEPQTAAKATAPAPVGDSDIPF